MASGNQVCSPSCADFPIAPINKKKHATDRMFILKNRKFKDRVLKSVTSANTVSNVIELLPSNSANTPNKTPTSPTLFTTIALIAALFAAKRVNQKVMSK
jgi:hypothetical protein